MVTIGVEQLLSNSALDEMFFLENIRKLLKYAGRCDNKQHYEAIIEAAMVSTAEVITGNSPTSIIMSVPVNNHGAKNQTIS